MNFRSRFLLVAAVALAAICEPSISLAQQYGIYRRQTIAYWRFEPGVNFLNDSSVNRLSLQPLLEAPDAVQPVQDKPPGVLGNGSAYFSGSAGLVTVDPLNLEALIVNRTSPNLRRVAISWYQRVQTLETQRIVFSHSPDFGEVDGGFAVGANCDYDGTPAPLPWRGFIGYRPLLDMDVPGPMGPLAPPANTIVRIFPQATGVVPPAGNGTWQFYEVQIGGTNNNTTEIQVFNASRQQISSQLVGNNGSITFGNLPFFVGAVTAMGQLQQGFVGNIDELRIENLTDSPGPGPGPAPGPGPGPGPGAFPGPDPGPFPGAIVGPDGPANGVVIDAKGVLRLQHFDDPRNKILLERIASARKNLNPKLAKASPLRKVSLNRLEAAVQARLEMNQPPTEEMQYLAGLTRLRYVFYYPDSKDIVLAGPAEGWIHDAADVPRGLPSGRPVLQLQDLVVALRAFKPGGKGESVILVSIDPTQEGLARMQAFLKSIGGTVTPDDTEMITNGLRTSLGMQNVRVSGISPSTHFAKVLLECDYRMKLIGVGLEKPPVKIATFVERARPTRGANSALQRWYFTPDYNCARVAADGLGLELVGEGVKLVNEDQIVDKQGVRAVTRQGNNASSTFTTAFTRKYAELAAALPVFAEMRNCIDLAIAAAFIHEHDFYARSGWQAATFNAEQALAVETVNVPKHTETICAAVWKGSTLMTPVGGGVTIHPREALRAKNTLADEDGRVSATREAVDVQALPNEQWWWD